MYSTSPKTDGSLRKVKKGFKTAHVKPLIFFGGCNFRKGKYLAFCRLSNSQCGGQGFDRPLLHQLFSTIYSHRQLWLFWPSGQYVTNFSKSKLHCLYGDSLTAFNHPHVTHGHPNI